ncbi:hypothetical protein ATANTOWER_008775 [Ataeniobius toweri]|uniref:Uncharacterized protein n=1 Tax=Ataeniobius toweri TaxID=208326 RepID=A0ABU7BPG9_9TELE|nr:hypothetical protein [Ataeniobius toweri]
MHNSQKCHQRINSGDQNPPICKSQATAHTMIRCKKKTKTPSAVIFTPLPITTGVWKQLTHQRPSSAKSSQGIMALSRSVVKSSGFIPQLDRHR